MDGAGRVGGGGSRVSVEWIGLGWGEGLGSVWREG